VSVVPIKLRIKFSATDSLPDDAWAGAFDISEKNNYVWKQVSRNGAKSWTDSVSKKNGYLDLEMDTDDLALGKPNKYLLGEDIQVRFFIDEENSYVAGKSSLCEKAANNNPNDPNSPAGQCATENKKLSADKDAAEKAKNTWLILAIIFLILFILCLIGLIVSCLKIKSLSSGGKGSNYNEL
jgi:hypothetical protein